MTTRATTIRELADWIEGIRRPHPVLVGIDGVDGAGKTTLADELGAVLTARGRTPIRASIDGFHHPRVVRYRRGAMSPEGFFHDSYDLEALEDLLLGPLGPQGDRRYRTACFDWRTDRAVEAPLCLAPDDALLLFDGIFLHRPELRDAWTESVFVDVAFETSLERNIERYEREHGHGEVDVVRECFRKRYMPGQVLYLESCRPTTRATVIVENDDLTRPRLAWRRDRA